MIGMLCLGFVLGAAIIIAYVHLLVLPMWKDDQSRIFAHLEHDRDQARVEAATFRRMILPRFDQTVSGATLPENAAARTPQPISGPPQPFRNRRISTRQWMKQMGARFNSKQQRVDAIAQQITSQQATQEKVV